jgi:hypothetical protein
VYLRPAPRSRLLLLLADLGIFLVEHQGAIGARRAALSNRADFIILVGGAEREHAELAGRLTRSLDTVLVAWLPAGADPEPYEDEGATVCIPETATDSDFARLIGPPVREARASRRSGEAVVEFKIFRDILFRTMPPELIYNDRSVPLTQVETEVTLELAQALGKVVLAETLERHVASLSSRSELHSGYLKAIVRRIRRKVGELGGDPELLRNVRGFGYMLVA